jgi:fermentation-respiration switch protein FrsA (DUF1100 family)
VYRTTTRFLIRLLLVVALLGSSGSLTGCSSMMYQPSGYLFYAPSQLKLHPDEINFNSSDGTKLVGWYFSADEKRPKLPPKGLIVFFHGNAQNMSSHYLNLVWILKHGYDFFIFDYRGYGKSAGDPTPEGTLEDGKAAVRWAAQKWGSKGLGKNTAGKDVPLIILGQSLGGAIALRTAMDLKKEIPIRLVVADSTFKSYEDAGASVMSQHWITWLFQPFAYLLLSDKYAPGDHVSELAPVPLVVIHGDQDQVINYDLGLDLFKSAGEPKEFWPVPGGRHTDGMNRKDPAIRDRLLKKLGELSGE